MKPPAWVEEWRSNVLAQTNFAVEDVPLAASTSWRYRDGAIQHASGRFFSIVGGRWHERGTARVQPFIEQPEIGTLAFVQRVADGRPEVLVQAKVEPGNVGVVQLAPTCQATASNLACVHGGATPPGAGVLGASRVLHESLQSEQGTRFLGKRNRNVLARLEHPAAEPAVTHRWIAVDELLGLLPADFLINTDARSVLVTSPWRELVGRAPFSRGASQLSRELAESAATCDDRAEQCVRAELAAARATAPSAARVSLNEVPLEHRQFRVRHVRVTARGREVPTWDQPIIDSTGEGLVELTCGRRDGILKFLFAPASEPGLHNRIELGPSRCVAPGEARTARAANGKLLLECRQSEEGGRFFQDTNHFRIIDVGDATDTPGAYWLPLGTVQRLLRHGGWFTNEARSALALLLTWL